MSFMRACSAIIVFSALLCRGLAQDTLDSMPRYDRYTRMSREVYASITPASVTVRWSDDSKTFFYSFNGKSYKYDVEAHKASETNEKPPPPAAPRGRRRGTQGGPERGRQFSRVQSPDGKLQAVTRDRNVYISDENGKNEFPVTSDGNEASRIKYGVASWVYGEELGVRNAMWWSPDSKKLAFYRFDESKVKDYYVTMDEGQVQDRLDVEAYPKAGAPNPGVELYVYDIAGKTTTKIQTRFDDGSLAEYIYDVQWSPDGTKLLFNRTNRKQNNLQFCSADPGTGVARTIVEEKQTQSWAENHPEIKFLKDNRRFIWASERTGFKNYYLYDLDGKLLMPLTKNKVDAMRILQVDEDAGDFIYSSYGTDNPYLRQVHRAALNGQKDDQVTASDLDHDVQVSPDGKHFVDVADRSDSPPVSRLLDANGKVEDTFARSDITKFEKMGLKKTEIFKFKAADGRTECYGTLQFPSDFDPSKKYPVLLTVYGGPESGGINPRFQVPNPITEFGFIVVNIAGRGTVGRGKAFRDAVYGKLGIVEMDDQNAGIRSLGDRPYIDLSRVGVFGTSYGGYSTVMLMLRHPETFAVGCASSAVTNWHNYDSIYTERYMGLPADDDNASGYSAGSAMTYASALKGKLMLYFGSADNNVHPANTYQLTLALESAGKRYDMQVGTDKGHTTMNETRMWEYFVTHLILQPQKDPLALAWNRRKHRKYAAARSQRIAQKSA